MMRLNMGTKVNLGQLVYTSCRKGLGNGAGLQTQAISPSVSPEQRDEAESLSGYEPPDLPVHATDEELKTLCPVEFRYTRFESGRSAFSRLIYVGADYSGRHGNFIAHSLLVPNEDFSSYPVDWIAYTGWVDSVSDDPPLLDDVGLDDFKVGLPNFAPLAKFIESRTEFFEQLPSILHAVILSRKENRPVVIVDDSANAAMWVSTLTKLFTRNVVPAIEFSTFSNALSFSYDIQCTTENSDLDLSDIVFEREAYVFDFVSNKYSSLPHAGNHYATEAAGALLCDPERLLSFFKFVAGTDGAADGAIRRDELASVFDCYKSLYIDSSGMTPAVVSSAVRMAVERVGDQAEIVDRMIHGIDRANESYSSDDRVSVAASLVRDSGKLTVDARSQLSGCVERLLWTELKSTTGQWSQIDATLDAMRGVPPASFTESQVPVLVDLISKSIEEGSASEVLQFVRERLKRCAVAEPWLHENTLEIVEGAIERLGFEKVVASVFECLSGADVDSCAQLCMELSGDRFPADSVKHVGVSLSTLLDHSNAKRRSAIRKELSNRKAFHILLAESDHRRRSAGKHVGEFLKYIQELDGSIGTEFSEEIGEVLRCVWQDSSADTKTKVAVWVVQKPSQFQRLNEATRDEVMAHLDPIISVTPADREKRRLADALDRVSSSLGHKLPPLARVRRFLGDSGALESVSAADHAWEEIDVKLDPQHYALVATSLLETLIPKSTSAEDHWKTLVWCKEVCDQPSMFNSYKSYVQSRAMLKLPEAAAIAFALAAVGRDLEHAPGESEASFAESELDGWLKNLTGLLFQVIGDSVASDLESDGTCLGDWNERCNRIEESRGKFLPRITRAFGIRW